MGKKSNPCIGVCKFEREGHCIGCSMTKEQKAISKKLQKPNQTEAFMQLLVAQELMLGGYDHWQDAYDRKKKR